MFQINPETSAVTMHRGDTGAYYVQLTRSSGNDFDEGDVALYTIKKGTTVMMEREYALDDDDGLGNGKFLIAFRNSDTDSWASGSYTTEIRVVLNPRKDGTEVVDGDTVRTITQSKSTLTILDVQKEV